MTSPAEGPRLSMRAGRPRSQECTTFPVGPRRSLARTTIYIEKALDKGIAA